MFRSPRLALPLLLLPLPWMGCGAAPGLLVRQEVPQALLACQAAPAPPQAPFDDQALALWIVDLAAAGEDCRSRLASVKELLDGH